MENPGVVYAAIRTTRRGLDCLRWYDKRQKYTNYYVIRITGLENTRLDGILAGVYHTGAINCTEGGLACSSYWVTATSLALPLEMTYWEV